MHSNSAEQNQREENKLISQTKTSVERKKMIKAATPKVAVTSRVLYKWINSSKQRKQERTWMTYFRIAISWYSVALLCMP